MTKTYECLKVYTGEEINELIEAYTNKDLKDVGSVLMDTARCLSSKYVYIEDKPSKKSYGFVWKGKGVDTKDWDFDSFKRDSDEWYAYKDILESEGKSCIEHSGRYVIICTAGRYRLARLRYNITSRQGREVTMEELKSIAHSTDSKFKDMLDVFKGRNVNCVGFVRNGNDKFTYFVHENKVHICNNYTLEVEVL